MVISIVYFDIIKKMRLSRSYIPDNSGYSYPNQTDKHYIKVMSDDGTVFDKDYPYVDKSKKFRFRQRWTRILLYCIVFPMSYIKMGLKIRGKENLKKNKKLLKQGTLSVCNHVNRWDYIAIMNAIKPFKPYILVWDKNITGPDGKMVRSVGGIPIPENDMKATIAYMASLKDLLANGGWLHIYPEGSMWEFYRPIRPFKKGFAHLARIHDKPVVPLAISYRKPSWWRKKLFKQLACFNLCIGEPLFIDKSLPLSEQEDDLTIRCRRTVEDLAGFGEGENPYEPIFNNSQKIGD